MTPEAGPILMTPGPTRIPERVLWAGHRVLHHRTAAFSTALAECLERMRGVFGAATADVLPVHGTGRAALEGAVLNFFRPGDTVVACCNGRFGGMWARFADIHGLRVVRVSRDWERSVDPLEVADALDAEPSARAVTLVHSDTSTGVLNPVAEVAAVARARGRLVMVDGISSVGGAPFAFDDWGLDVAVTASQKCLMSAPGVSFAVVGPGAWREAERGGMPRSYLDFGAIRKSLAGARPETPGTAPVLLVLQVLEALRMIHEEGIPAVFERHRAMAARAREGAQALGFTLQCPDLTERSPTLTGLRVPPGTTPGALREAVLRRGIQLAGGLEIYKDSTLRIGHMGDIRPADVEAALQALAAALAETRTA